jgi:3-oxoacyl-[acyl-carrier protein] reductase
MNLKRFVPDRLRLMARAALGRDLGTTVLKSEIRLVSGEGLNGQVALVTGGSGAIGRSICGQLAAEGATVIVCGTSETRMAEVVAEIAGFGGKAQPQKLNVSSEPDIVATIAAIVAQHGRVDILVNCAGGSARENHATIADQRTEIIDDILAVNLRGVILTTREALKAMVPAGYGRIVNISSIIGDHGKAGFSEYAAAKAGVNGFTRSVAMEVAKYGITVNCVSPGIIHRGAVTEAVRARVSKTNWMGTTGKSEDIATLVSHLASSYGSFITGQNFAVDGGRSLGLKGD